MLNATVNSPNSPSRCLVKLCVFRGGERMEKGATKGSSPSVHFEADPAALPALIMQEYAPYLT